MSGVFLIPKYGVVGAGYAYLLGSMAHFLGVLVGWFYLFGTSSILSLMRFVGLPLLLAGISFILLSIIRSGFNELTWYGLFGLGGLFFGLTGLLVVGTDLVFGGESPVKEILDRFRNSSRLKPYLIYIGIKSA